MTTREFELLPMLLDRGQALAALGYSRTTLLKMVDAGGCARAPEAAGGIGFRRFRWRRWWAGHGGRTGAGADAGRAALLAEKMVINWTGHSRAALERIVRAAD